MKKRILLLFLCVTMIFAVLGPLEAGRLSQSVAEGLNANALPTVPDQLFQYIDQQAFSEMNHTERMTSKESMSTYVFANEDGSWSTYFFDENVKFIASDGKIHEKDLSLVNDINGYHVADNEYDLIKTRTAGSYSFFDPWDKSSSSFTKLLIESGTGIQISCFGSDLAMISGIITCY